MTLKHDRDLEEKIRHPEGIGSSLVYTLDDGVEIKVEYLVDDLEYKEGELYGHLRLRISKLDENGEYYEPIFHERLEKMLLIGSKGLHFSNSYEESRREDEIIKEYVDIFSMRIREKADQSEEDWEDFTLVPSMLEEPFDNLFTSIREQYKRV